MNEANLIRRQLERVGNGVYLHDGEWTSMPFYAVTNYLWRKKSSAFEPQPSEIGLVDPEYYLYIGPSNHDITALSEKAYLETTDGCFSFMRRDCVRKGDEVIYYTGILVKHKEESGYEEY